MDRLPADDGLDGYLRAMTASRLPTYRRVDLQGLKVESQHTDHLSLALNNVSPADMTDDVKVKVNNQTIARNPSHKHGQHPISTPKKPHQRPRAHSRSHSLTLNSPPPPPADLNKFLPSLPRSETFNRERDLTLTLTPPNTNLDNTSAQTGNTSRPETRKVPALHSRNDRGENHSNRPPPAMITQRSFPLENNNSTQDWVASQQSPVPEQPPASPAHPNPNSLTSPTSTRNSTEINNTNPSSRPPILPIRGFKPSRRSAEMASKRTSMNDPDSTLRTLEGLDQQRSPGHPEQEEQNSDESDLFLRAAREEELRQRNGAGTDSDRLIRTDKRRAQIGQRASLPPSSTVFHPSAAPRRRGSENEGSTVSRPMDDNESIGQALTYRPPGRERPSALDDLNRSRYYGTNSRSGPSTPRTFGSREISPESQSQVSYGGRRPSIPEQSVPARTTSYRQSNLSYSTPRTYNSSPLVSRSTDMHMHDTPPEIPRAAEGTESSVSTTAPSTVWDELEELKSRIHRLELTGKLPTTSGAAVSRASSERPPTATTTATTMSSSPKRGRNNSISPIDSTIAEGFSESHPLLSSALAKSKSLLNPDVYKALEAAASDALAITSMMGTSGQPGPISSSQSTVGGLPTASDRQVRRKANSMCQSLTELCLALSEVKAEDSQPKNQLVQRPASRDSDVRPSIETNNNLRLGMSNDLARVKSSPRALSRLEARRSSLLTGSSLPSPRYNPSEGSTPTQSTMAGRRTSMLLRSTRRGTEEPEDNEEARFRAPSRANTDIGRVRNSPREYSSQQPLPERLPERLQGKLPERSNSIQSSLPVRRHYPSNSLPNNGQSMPPVSSLGGRRYLDRTTPERDTSNVIGRLAGDRAQHNSSIGQGFPSPTTKQNRSGSLTRRNRQSTSADMSAGQNSYQ